MAITTLSVRLFGAIAVTRGSSKLGARDFGGTKTKQLFELLVLARGEPMPKDRLADLIWGDRLPVHVNATLETYVSVLRRTLAAPDGSGRDLITTQHEAYTLPTSGYELDLARFDELVRLADVAEPSTRRRYLEDALALATGEVLADEPYSDWAIDERWRYERRVIDAALGAAAAAAADRDLRGALAHAERAIALDPHDERAYHPALSALHGLGRNRDAVALYDRLVELNERDGGETISAALHELRATIARGEAIASPARLRAATRAAGAASTRMLGRSGELEQIEHALAAAAAGGSELVLVEGERGIGKTTLLETATRDLDGISVGWARCSELVSGIPYAALALALREVLGESGVDVRSYPALAAVFPELRVRSTRALPRTVDALESLGALLEALSPLALVLDDLHWADPDTLVALDYLATRGSLKGVTVIASVAPEELGAGHRLSRLRPSLRIPLGELDERDLIPLGIADIYERTQGHPLFVSLAVASDEGGKRAAATWAATRCRSEGDASYRLLSAACLLEESFTASRLAAVLDLKAADLIDSLDRLCHRRLLSPSESGYQFRCSLLREALADSLSPAARGMLQLRITQDGPPGPQAGRTLSSTARQARSARKRPAGVRLARPSSAS